MASWLIRFCVCAVVSVLLAASIASEIPTGGLLVFEEKTSRSPLHSAIVVSGADGTGRRVLAGPGASPLWFPSGDRVAYFVADKTSHSQYYIAWTASLPGKTVFVDLGGKAVGEVPYYVTDIAPNGAELLVQRKIDSNEFDRDRILYELCVYDLRNGSLRRVFGPDQIPKGIDAVYPEAAKWLPDGKRILFKLVGPNNQRRSPLISAFAEINSDGSEFRMLTNMPEIKPGMGRAGPKEFDISPDGKRIVYLEEGDRNLYVIDLADLKAHRVTSDGQPNLPLYMNPVWSPRGNKILYTRYSTSKLYSEIALMTMNFDGTQPRRVFPRTWRHFIKEIVLHENDDHADWWAPKVGQKQ
jgi:Tol biopolymer transport system component